MRSPKPLALALPSLLVLPSVAVPQQKPARFIQVITTTVKPSAVTEYEDYVKKFIAGGNKVGAAQYVYGHQVMMGGPGYTYQFVLPFHEWSELDGWSGVALHSPRRGSHRRVSSGSEPSGDGCAAGVELSRSIPARGVQREEATGPPPSQFRRGS